MIAIGNSIIAAMSSRKHIQHHHKNATKDDNLFSLLCCKVFLHIPLLPFYEHLHDNHDKVKLDFLFHLDHHLKQEGYDESEDARLSLGKAHIHYYLFQELIL